MAKDCSKRMVLQDVVAFVDVWSSSKTENYSKPFIGHLTDMGATVLKYFNKQVTHVVFKDGHESVWKKAKKTGVKLVSVLWVERCMATCTHVDESLFPAVNDSKSLPENKRTHRCMKPRDFIEKTPENDKRLQRKLDQMIQNLDLNKTTGVDLPLLSFDGDATDLHIPKMKTIPLNHFCRMEERLKEMKDKRENLSPTASQMSQTSISGSAASLCQPSLGESPSITPKENQATGSEYTSTNDPCGSFDNENKSLVSIHACAEQVDQHSTPESLADSFHLLSANCDLINKTSMRRTKKTVAATKLVFPKERSSSASSDGTGASTSSCNVQRNRKYSEGGCLQALDHATQELKVYNIIRKANRNLPPPGQVSSSVKEGDIAEMNSMLNVHHKSNISPLKHKCSSSSKKNPTSSKKNSDLCKPQNELFEARPFSSRSPCDYSMSEVYEDFFSPDNLNGQRKSRLPLRVFPPESPSPPKINSVCVKQKRKLQGTNQPSSTARTKRMKVMTNFNASEQLNPGVCNSNESLNMITVIDNNNPHKQNDAQHPVATRIHNRRKFCIKQLLEHFLDKSEELPSNKLSLKKGSGFPKGNGERKFDLFSNDSPPTYFYDHRSGVNHSSNLHNETKNNSLNSLKFTDQLNKEQNEMEKVQHHQKNELSKEILTTGNDMEDKHLNEPCQSHNKKYTTELTRTTIGCKGKTKKPSRTLVMTSMPSENQIIVMQVVKHLGGFLFSDQVNETTTHVVAGHPRRTLNVLFGIAQGCWILSFDWILWSLEQGFWVPEEPYELSAQFPAATICRLEKQSAIGSYRQDLFANQPLIFISPRSEPPTLMLEKLIQLCGGKVCKTLRKAEICIGQYKGKRPPGSRHLSEGWILDCITQHALCSIDNYRID
ncbi:microcephalin isoform X1 [Chiloscyllium punctatum]|uniref:microcephalin isoform X1 n=1 Tax=Chiloscyllium punctatum TaxID=137246 RepID=UPI003B63689D